jgi:hypothetical protein
MTTPARSWRIDTVLFLQGAAEAVHALTAAYMRHDRLDQDAAFRAACDLLASESPWLLARRGQTWDLDGAFFATAEMPRRIRIRRVLPACAKHPMRVQATDLARGAWRRPVYLRVDDLDACYALTAWPNPPRRTGSAR